MRKWAAASESAFSHYGPLCNCGLWNRWSAKQFAAQVVPVGSRFLCPYAGIVLSLEDRLAAKCIFDRSYFAWTARVPSSKSNVSASSRCLSRVPGTLQSQYRSTQFPETRGSKSTPILIIVRLLSPETVDCLNHQFYSGVGADIVME